MATKKKNNQGEGGGVLNRQGNYNKLAKHFDLAVKTLVDILKHGKQEAVKLSAANKIIDKILPNLQATDLTTGGDKIAHNVIETATKRHLESPPKTNGSIGKK